MLAIESEYSSEPKIPEFYYYFWNLLHQIRSVLFTTKIDIMIFYMKCSGKTENDNIFF